MEDTVCYHCKVMHLTAPRPLGAIVPIGEMSYFIKAYGPEEMTAEHQAAFDEFLQSLQQQ